ncbi:MAG: hypothetical protein ABIQ29_10035 [Burkholderiaceae bacterium]
MHAAPPVRIDLAPDRAAGWAVLLLATVAAANAALWLGALAEWKGAKLGGFGVAAALAVVAWLRGRRLGCVGLLTWDGSAWLWVQAVQRPVVPRVMLDLGGWILLRLQPLDGSRTAIWGVATRARARAAWSAWRAALLSPSSPVHTLPRTPA